MTCTEPDRSIPLLVFGGKGAAMTLLVDKNGHKKGPWHLPRITVNGALSPKAQASRLLAEQHPQAMPTGFSPVYHEDTDGKGPDMWCIVGHVQGDQPIESDAWVALAEIDRFAGQDGHAACAALARFWTLMPTANPEFRGIRAYGDGSDGDHAIFFGGSFNPWHRAHRACIELCPFPERVVVVPDANPKKPIIHSDCPWHEFQQLVEEVTGLGSSVFPGYTGLNRPNPTSSWLPNTAYGKRDLLIGDDSWATLPEWIDSERLVQALHAVWIAPRRSSKAAIEFTAKWLHRVAPRCEIHFLGNHPYRDLSSTAIRQSQT